MGIDETLEEPDEPVSKKVTALVRVLSYDDLLLPRARMVRLDGRVRPLLLGRGEDDGLTFDDPWMSGRHATIVKKGGSDVLVDEGSRNKTFVNGRSIREHRLADGDLIEIGHTLLVYRTFDERLLSALPDDGVAFGPTVTRSPDLALVARDLARLAPSAEPVLILGDTGSGKEIAAAMIHEMSGRTGPMVAIDCGAIPDSLFEATLFGHERGAFTSAADARKGEIERAAGGTMFLDEIGNLSEASQAKLLRVIETNVVTPVGGSPRSVDVRWIAATNRDVASDADFRDDLLRRIASYVANIPSLSSRREDLGELTAFILSEAGVESASMAVSAGRAFYSGGFAGNIRQLKTALRTAALLAQGEPIDQTHLPSLESETEVVESGETTAADIEAALQATRGNVVQAAKRLETHPRQLYRWIKQYDLSLDEFRGDPPV